MNRANSFVEDADSEDEPVNKIQHPFGELYCVQTVELDPNQTLPIKLVISANKRLRPIGSFAYKLHAQVVPLERLQEKIPVLSSSGVVYYAPVAAWRSLLPLFAALFVFLFSLLIWFLLFAMFWQ
jgi:hypothetical protein